MPLPILALFALGTGAHFAGEAMDRKQSKRRNEFEQAAADAAARNGQAALDAPVFGTPEEQARMRRDAVVAAHVQNSSNPLESIRTQSLTSIDQALDSAAEFARKGALDPLNREAASASIETARVTALQAQENWKATTANGLNDDYRKAVAPMANATTKAQIAAEQMKLVDTNNPVAAFNAIRAMIQQVDASMVTSDEMAAVAGEFGLKQQLDNWLDYLDKGGAVNSEAVAQMVESMNSIAQVYQSQGQRITTDFRTRAGQQGITNADWVTGGTNFNPYAALTNVADRLPQQNAPVFTERPTPLNIPTGDGPGITLTPEQAREFGLDQLRAPGT